MVDFDISILQCPVTKEGLQLLTGGETRQIVENFDQSFLSFENITEGLVNDSRTYFYPIFDGIVLLLPVYALYLGKGEDLRGTMVFDKQRVFNYYNQINYNIQNKFKIYSDSAKWVDYRDVSAEYIHNSFTRAGKYLPAKGKYLLDIASGPIGCQEYLDLSNGYEIRICADISVNALLEARYNYEPRKGIYLCADITNIPLRDNVVDAVLCQHTLYHIPKDEQVAAVNEMHRVAAPGGVVAIVYSWFYHSLIMNIVLFPVQLYRVARHIAGKLYVKLFNSKPRLYFYPHSRRWFIKKFPFGPQIQFFCWRSTNKYFMDIYIHKWLGGEKILRWLRNSEDKHPEFWGKYGDYPVIVIKK